MRTYSVSAIVLRRIDLGEKDRILTIFTRELGKLSAVAKGSRRPGSKLAGASEPLTYSKLFLSIGKELDIITQADIRESFPNVKADIRSIAYGIYILELVYSFLDEREPNSDLFDTLLSALYILESGTDPEITTRYFELHLLHHLGYEPNFECCINCGKKPGLKDIAFSPSKGAIICTNCGPLPIDAILIPGAMLSYVHALRKAAPNRLKDMKIPRGARRDLSRTLKWHIRHRLEHSLKSTSFIDALNAYECNGQ